MNNVFVHPSCLHRAFIIATKGGTDPPTASASAIAASFPDGSRKPFNPNDNAKERIMVPHSTMTLFAFDAVTGKELWSSGKAMDGNTVHFTQPVVALGKLAFDAYLGILRDQGVIRSRAAYVFRHNVQHEIPGGAVLVGSYHPSQQNTSTGKLTAEMLREVFERARAIIQG